MLNSSSSSQSKVEIKGSASGIIQKQYPQSWFRKMHMDSPLADIVFCNSPHIKENDKRVKIVVLQVLLMGDGVIMVEMINEDDFLKQ